MSYENFEEYIRHGQPSQQEKAVAWQTAIGLQAVDGLKTSDYLIQTAKRHIDGEIDIDEVKASLRSYYITKVARTQEEQDTEEADKVAANITKLLSSPTFAFTLAGFTAIHYHIFDGVYKHAGKIRDYDITKKEWVLNGDTVLYVNCEDASRAIEYDLEQERKFSYKGLTQDEIIEHISLFISGLWQIYPFCEGNTRTTAVFAIKYLRSLGFAVDNALFANHSWYFRNALVRANYRNAVKGIEREPIHLIRFFRNLLLGEQYELKNRYLHIDYAIHAGQVQDKLRTSSENQFEIENAYIQALISAIGTDTLSVREMMERLSLKGRDNFLKLYLTPALADGWVKMLYPNSPNHPRQKYLLTIKGLGVINNIIHK